MCGFVSITTYSKYHFLIVGDIGSGLRWWRWLWAMSCRVPVSLDFMQRRAEKATHKACFDSLTRRFLSGMVTFVTTRGHWHSPYYDRRSTCRLHHPREINSNTDTMIVMEHSLKLLRHHFRVFDFRGLQYYLSRLVIIRSLHDFRRTSSQPVQLSPHDAPEK